MAKSRPIQVQSALEGLDYPAKKEDIRKHAEKHGADNEVLTLLDKLPAKEYNSPVDVSKEVGKIQ